MGRLGVGGDGHKVGMGGDEVGVGGDEVWVGGDGVWVEGRWGVWGEGRWGVGGEECGWGEMGWRWRGVNVYIAHKIRHSRYNQLTNLVSHFLQFVLRATHDDHIQPLPGQLKMKQSTN